MKDGNLTEYLNEFQRLYSELLKKGKDLYSLGHDPIWVLGLDKIERESVENRDGIFGYVKLRPEDAKEIKKMFPKSSRSEEEIMKNCSIKPFTGNNSVEFLNNEDLEGILEGKPAKVYSVDIDTH